MPPRLALLLLRTACSARDWPWVPAELETEYERHILPRGRTAARRWFWSQALRSSAALAMNGLRSGDWECAVLWLLLAAAGPAVFLEAWWGWLLHLVPLKADLARGADFLAIALAAHALLGLLAGTLCTLRGLPLAVPAAWLFALLGQSAARSVTPPWFCAAALLVLTLALCSGALVRRIFDRPQAGRFA